MALELQQARYEAKLAERRYAACDPDNRLIDAQLEKNWETALCRVEDLETRQADKKQATTELDADTLADLAQDLTACLACARRDHAGTPAAFAQPDRRYRRRRR